MIYFLDFKASYTIYMIQNESRVSKLCSWSFKTMWGGNYPTLLETQNFMTPCYFGAPIFLRCKRTAPHRILSCIWVISLFSSLVLVAIKNTYIPKAQKEPLIALSFLFDSSIFGFPSSRDIFSSLSFPIGTAVYHVSSWPPMISLLLFCGSSSNDPAFLWSASMKSVHPDVVSRRYVPIPSGIPSGVSLTIALNFAGCYQSPAL